MSRSVLSVVVLMAVLSLGVAGLVDAGVTGEKKKGGVKGRYLDIESGVHLRDYRGALVILEPAEIIADKDKPVDNEAVRSTSDEVLREKLQAAGVFGELVSAAPTKLPADRPAIRLSTKLTLEHGSQAMRFFVGAGAGKSKLHIRVGLVDAASGKPLGYFNGYGTGAGLVSISGGGVQRMARDDLDENYTKFAELLQEQMN